MMACAAGLLLAMLVGIAPVSASALTAAPPMQLVPAAQIASLAERTARSLVPDPQRALAPAYTVSDQQVPAGTVAIVAGTPQVNATYVSVPIAIDVDGKLARTVFTGFRLTSYVHVPLAAHDLPAGTVLGPDDLTSGRMPFSGRPDIDVETVVGRKIRAAVAGGAVVLPEMTTVNVIVRAGMPAVLIVHDGPVRLAADVIARTSGGLGEYVTVFNPQTQRALSGVVTGPNTVELTLPGASE